MNWFKKKDKVDESKKTVILLMDDDSSSMRTTSKAIRKIIESDKRADIELVQFMEAAFAFRYFRTNPMPDLILCDYEMPVMGPLVIAWFKKQGFSGKSYYVSAYEIPPTELAKVDGFIPKPFSLNDFREVLKNVR